MATGRYIIAIDVGIKNLGPLHEIVQRYGEK